MAKQLLNRYLELLLSDILIKFSPRRAERILQSLAEFLCQETDELFFRCLLSLLGLLAWELGGENEAQATAAFVRVSKSGATLDELGLTQQSSPSDGISASSGAPHALVKRHFLFLLGASTVHYIRISSRTPVPDGCQ